MNLGGQTLAMDLINKRITPISNSFEMGGVNSKSVTPFDVCRGEINKIKLFI